MVKFLVKFYGFSIEFEDDCLCFGNEKFLFSYVLKKRVKSTYQFNKALDDVHRRALKYVECVKNITSYFVEVVHV